MPIGVKQYFKNKDNIFKEILVLSHRKICVALSNDLVGGLLHPLFYVQACSKLDMVM